MTLETTLWQNGDSLPGEGQLLEKGNIKPLKVVAPGKFHVFKQDHFQPSCSSCHVIFKKRGFIPK